MSSRNDREWLLDEDAVKKSGCGLLSPKKLRRELVSWYRQQIHSRRRRGGRDRDENCAGISTGDDDDRLPVKKNEFADTKACLAPPQPVPPPPPLDSHSNTQKSPPKSIRRELRLTSLSVAEEDLGRDVVAPILVSVPVPAKSLGSVVAQPHPQPQPQPKAVVRNLYQVLAVVPVMDVTVIETPSMDSSVSMPMHVAPLAPIRPVKRVGDV